MKCPNCNGRVDADEKLCHNCGSKLSFGDKSETSKDSDGYDASSEISQLISMIQPVDKEQTDANTPNAQDSLPAYMTGIPVAEKATAEKKNSGKGVIGIAAAAVVIVVAIAAAFVLGGSMGSAPDVKKPETTEATHNHDDEDDGDIWVDSWYEWGTTEETEEETTQGSYGEADAYLERMERYGRYIESPDYTFGPVTYIVNEKKGLRIRTGPSEYDSKQDTLHFGVIVETFGKDYSGDWYLVYCEDEDMFGWVNAEYISPTKIEDPYEVTYFQYAIRKRVTDKDVLNLRVAPSVNAKRIVHLKESLPVTVLGISDADSDWYYVEAVQNGVTFKGFCHGDHLYDM